MKTLFSFTDFVFEQSKPLEARSTEMATVPKPNETSAIDSMIATIKNMKYLDLLKKFIQQKKSAVKNNSDKYAYCLYFKFC